MFGPFPHHHDIKSVAMKWLRKVGFLVPFKAKRRQKISYNALKSRTSESETMCGSRVVDLHVCGAIGQIQRERRSRPHLGKKFGTWPKWDLVRSNVRCSGCSITGLSCSFNRETPQGMVWWDEPGCKRQLDAGLSDCPNQGV